MRYSLRDGCRYSDSSKIAISSARKTMVTLNFKNREPIYRQIAEQIKNHIMINQLKPGDMLPSMIELASPRKNYEATPSGLCTMQLYGWQSGIIKLVKSWQPALPSLIVRLARAYWSGFKYPRSVGRWSGPLHCF